MRALFRIACSRRIVANALRIALLVGTVLNLVNQGGAIISGSGVSWLHLVLNYAVPYCVASYSAARNQMTQRGDE
ncbi:MAG: nitrate/nitrite transporter NrtS [Rhodoferax sp.]|uniref:nitrate/nitrite transporter NrtS n=1 Tax=Rhodoferax sp. TaxID=50421 RepID=UPI00261880E9|nr:nitrate/nitrite transporter NrtS [Rhodoferax sp.]MDD5336492.1 nitrate/nitrite transporter NrtS [Rhodoferax sp.]